MDLSNDLVSQFAKITTGDKDKNNETTVYATVRVYDGITCVKIDGSDLLTPVDTTTEVKDGERVTVLIKNHSAVITGNTSDPSAAVSTTNGISETLTKVSADVGVFKNLTTENFEATSAKIENLTAKDAQIENLVATKASISELEAVQAKIKDLDVEYVNAELAEINEAIIKKADIELLNAETAAINEALIKKADIVDLNALDAEINNLSSNFATIQQLNAANANINTLDAEVADIQTLVNGNLTSDNISSLNLTSANTTVANAFIKDAMIDSVTASKLTAGIIDTSAITIKSTDGSMLITGSVQQFKDENGKVRIQIGKDNGGNFTFILYDESGTGVLIDESGIKSSEAIADGLIVNSKVAANANISGSKLDIASVITEVNNDNSTTIKSNKIYLNEQGQSLEVAFNSLKTQVETIQDVSIDGDLTSIKEQVQSNTTQINANKNGISTLVSQNELRKEEIKNLDDEIVEVSTDINSKYTSLQQDLSGFKTIVGGTYTTKTEFNNLNVGGTNLLPNSKTLSGWVTEGVLQDGHYDDTFTGAFMSYNDTSGYKEVLCKNSFLKLEPNTQYTLSFWARGNGKFYSYLYKESTPVVSSGYNSSGITTTGSDGSIATTLTDNNVLKRYWITWTTSNSITKDTLLNLIVARAHSGLGNCNIVICGIKLEKGNKATDWSPSPEDVQGEIDAVSNDLTANYSTTSQMNSAINQKANEITSSVSQTYTTKTEFNNLNVGGRNYASLSNFKTYAGGSLINPYACYTINGTKITATNQSLNSPLPGFKVPTDGNNFEFTVSGYTDLDVIVLYTCCYDSSGTITRGQQPIFVDVINGYFTTSISNIPSTTNYVNVGVGNDNVANYFIDKVKIEKGNKATDWSPAPEDIQDHIDTVSNNLTNNYSTTSAMNSAINQKANEITSAVSETYTTKAEFNNLNVGGTNLYPNSNFKETVTGREHTPTLSVTYSDAVESNQKRYGGKILQLFNAGSGTSDIVDNYYTLDYQLTLEPNTTYTLSYDYFDAGSHYANSGYIYLWQKVNDGSTRQVIPLSHTVYTDKKRRRHTQTFTTDDTRLIFELRFGFINTAPYWIAIEGVKLEKGNKATDWSPSPEDVQGEIDAVSNNLATNYSTTSQMNSAINQKANEITSSVSQTYATKQSVTDVSNNLTNNYSTTSAMNTAINQKANEITNSVSQTYTTKSEFNNLNIGGRNLLATPNETTVYSSTGVSGNYIDTLTMVTSIIPIGTEYIVSFEAKASANMTCKCFFYNPNTTNGCESSTGYKGTSVDGSCYVNITTSWTRYWVKWTQAATNEKKWIIVGRNETAGVTLEIRAVKFEEGNKPTAWSPAPELTTNSINNLTTRMQTAESKLTKESLTTTIGDYYATESKISSYGYATTSQVTQTKNELTATFKSVGGYNLIRNSCGYGGTRGWGTNCTLSNLSDQSFSKTVGIDSILYITNTATSEKFAFSPRFELKPNTQYTLSGYIWKNPNVTNYEVYMLTSTSVIGSDTGTSYTDTLLVHSGSAQSATYFVHTFTTVANTISGYVRIDHNGYNNSGDTDGCNVHFTGLCLVEGSVAKPWSPHPSETYSATTTVDAKGIKVTHTDAVGYTQMDANGFYLNDGSKNVLSVTSSGANFNMPINARLITTGTLSGDRISGGKISAADEINFIGGARIFGKSGELGAGLEVSAAGISLGGGSVNYLKGSWFVLDGDLEIESGDLVLNSGCKIDCYGIDSTSISCTTINSSAITCTSITASSNIDCSGIIYGRGSIALDRGSIWTAIDGSVTRDIIRFNSNLLTSDSSSSKIYLLNTNGDFCTLRAARVETGGDVTCWNLWAGGAVYANNVALTSDKRLKTDIRYVNIDEQSIGESGLMSPNVNITTKDMLEFIESIPFASYRMKSEVEKDIDYTYYGFIAQDLLENKVGSELIEHSEVIVENKTYDDEGRERIEYTTEERLRYSENKFIAFLAGAVQEDIKQRKAADKELMDMLNTIINE